MSQRNLEQVSTAFLVWSATCPGMIVLRLGVSAGYTELGPEADMDGDRRVIFGPCKLCAQDGVVYAQDTPASISQKPSRKRSGFMTCYGTKLDSQLPLKQNRAEWKRLYYIGGDVTNTRAVLGSKLSRLRPARELTKSLIKFRRHSENPTLLKTKTNSWSASTFAGPPKFERIHRSMEMDMSSLLGGWGSMKSDVIHDGRLGWFPRWQPPKQTNTPGHLVRGPGQENSSIFQWNGFNLCALHHLFSSFCKLAPSESDSETTEGDDTRNEIKTPLRTIQHAADYSPLLELYLTMASGSSQSSWILLRHYFRWALDLSDYYGGYQSACLLRFFIRVRFLSFGNKD
ncbi:hypothetical protein F5146DRAFT_1119836 [Armillaria mellea]|nr:hypothetical protein F5146DRAFT_1119836 [Armillaria mellea]